MDLKGAGAGGYKLPFHAIRAEHDAGIARTFQYFLVHLPVAAVFSALAAGCVNEDLSAYFLGRRVEVDCARLHRE